jgi:hypothetical protein
MRKLGRFALVGGMVLLLNLGSLGVAASPAPVEPARTCTPGYRPCIPLRRSDVDCYGGSGNGPRYTRRGVVYHVRRGMDRYRLDADHDGRGCE